MKTIIDFLGKHHLLCLSPFGLFVALFIGYGIWSYFDYMAVAYIFGVAAYAGSSLLIYFDWGYHETEPERMGVYTGIVLFYAIFSTIIAMNGYETFGWLDCAVSALICTLMGVFLIIPIIKFFQQNNLS